MRSSHFIVCSALAALLGLSSVEAASRIDHEAETTWRKLTWEDFRGSVRRGQQSAGIVTTIVVNTGGSAIEETDAGIWVARPGALAIYASMNKLESGVRPGGRSDAMLAHEQLHFDVAEIHARRLHAQLQTVKAEGESRQFAQAGLLQAIKTAHSETMEAFLQMQAHYDGETAHGTRKKMQKKWVEKIASLLEAEEPYPLR